MATSSTPLLEFLIPGYNRPSIVETIQSVLEQCDNLVDSGLVSVQVADDAGELYNVEQSLNPKWLTDARLRVVRNAENLGMAENLRSMITRSAARFVFILTDDDLLEPGALSHCVSLLQSNFCHAAYVTPRPGWDIDGRLRVVDCRVSRRRWKVLNPTRFASLRFARHGHILSGLILERDAVDLNFWGEIADSAYFPVIIFGDLLQRRSVLYGNRPLVVHRIYNETFWHRWGDSDAEIAARLFRDHAEAFQIIHKWLEGGKFARLLGDVLLVRELLRLEVSSVLHHDRNNIEKLEVESRRLSFTLATMQKILRSLQPAIRSIHSTVRSPNLKTRSF